MLTEAKKISFFLLFSAIVMVVSVCSFDFSGHDYQRVAQLIVGCFSLAVLVVFGLHGRLVVFFYGRVKIFFLLILLGGIVSSVNAHQPAWALIEISVLVLCCGIVMAVAQQRTCYGAGLDKFLVGFVVFICAIKTLQFISSTVAAFVASTPLVDTDLLLEGFSNKRFYGQFQTLTLPVLALPLLFRGRWAGRVFFFVLLSCWWMIAIAGGTRGTWLGMGAAIVLIFCLGRAGRHWAAWQLCAASIGVLIFVLVFSLIPAWMGMDVTNFAGDRLNTSLSAREILWQQAWSMIKERPLLGFGPMHFSDIWNAVGSHPHQAILQWASEWGVPSALCVIALALYGLIATARLLHKRALSREPVDLLRICLAASLVGGLAQAMVDGVIVMPYSQIWLALIVGWLLALHESPASLRTANPIANGIFLAGLTLASGLLFCTVARDLPVKEEREQQFAKEFGGRYLPRFWMQGVIAQPDKDIGQVSSVR